MAAMRKYRYEPRGASVWCTLKTPLMSSDEEESMSGSEQDDQLPEEDDMQDGQLPPGFFNPDLPDEEVLRVYDEPGYEPRQRGEVREDDDVLVEDSPALIENLDRTLFDADEASQLKSMEDEAGSFASEPVPGEVDPSGVARIITPQERMALKLKNAREQRALAGRRIGQEEPQRNVADAERDAGNNIDFDSDDLEFAAEPEAEPERGAAPLEKRRKAAERKERREQAARDNVLGPRAPDFRSGPAKAYRKMPRPPLEAGFEIEDLVSGKALEGARNSFNATLLEQHQNRSEAGGSASAQQAWFLWMTHFVDHQRKNHPTKYCKNRRYLEDMLLGPVDGPRRLDVGFERKMAPSLDVEIDSRADQLEGSWRTIKTAAGNRVDVYFYSEIVWYVMEPRHAQEGDSVGNRVVPREMKSAAALLAHIDAAGANGKTVQFRPGRIHRNTEKIARRLEARAPEETSLRTNRPFFGGAFRKRREWNRAVLNPVTGDAEMEPRLPGDKKWARRRDGSRIFVDGNPVIIPKYTKVRHVTKTMRALIREVPLTEDHWEWMYSRYLTNLQVFDLPRKIPEMEYKPREKKIAPHLSNAAIPLMTRGTMNFYAMRLNPNKDESLKPKLAIQDLATLTTGADPGGAVARVRSLATGAAVARVRSLERVRFQSTQRTQANPPSDEEDVGGRNFTSFVDAFWSRRLQELPQTLAPTRDPSVFVMIVCNTMANTFDPATIFCLCKVNVAQGVQLKSHEMDGAADIKYSYEYYRNVYVVPRSAMNEIRDLTTFEKRRSPIDGYRNSSEGASGAEGDAEGGAEGAFLGRPLYFMTNTKACPGVTQMTDIRIADHDKPLFSEPYYSSVYRMLMFEPLPFIRVQTFPPPRPPEPPQDATRTTQEKTFLNFGIDFSKAKNEKEPEGRGGRAGRGGGSAANDDLEDVEWAEDEWDEVEDEESERPPETADPGPGPSAGLPVDPRAAVAKEADFRRRADIRAKSVAPRQNKFHAPLKQRYPEVMISREKNVKQRAAEVRRFIAFLKSGEATDNTKRIVTTPFLKGGKAMAAPTSEDGKKEWREAFKKSNRDAAGILAPTRLGDAIRRHMV